MLCIRGCAIKLYYTVCTIKFNLCQFAGIKIYENGALHARYSISFNYLMSIGRLNARNVSHISDLLSPSNKALDKTR